MPGEENQVLWRGVRQVSGVRGIWPARNAERINKNQTRSTSGLSSIYQVPAGKRLFISTATLFSMNQTIQSTYSYLYVRNAAAVTQYMITIHYHEVVENFDTSPQYLPALEAEAGWGVYINNNTNNLKCRGFIFGWIEDE